MPEFVRRTWLPTLLFALPILLFELVMGPTKPLPQGALVAYAILVVPPIWRLTTPRQGRVSLARGAMAGLACGAVLIFIPVSILLVTFAVSPGDGGFVGIIALATLAIGVAIVVPSGAVVGVLAAFLLELGQTERPS